MKTYTHIAAKAIAATAAVAMLTGLTACGGGEATTDADGKPIVKILVVKNSNQTKIADMTWTK